ncbi:hypothetical protein [Actinoplanes teichomyceticus]|uniref:Uncharacterized protein n=1 Tax=Actinoplanes teichomyceticus TaxID=1867 RepID=A0A561WNM7_ACTTI|nr:hypothetical protein [Actinoplanes teichomyceticus]TWG25469.1 hypothetical protein FHX34_101438 [Actinoplanes teichomyceticus]GIF10538.1 hypothetical protein Ate01nite_05700 [Actinoplanes teichomyceticus]
MSDSRDDFPQNDPDRAGGLVSDAQGEFVKQHPGGAFDPRAFRPGSHPEAAPGTGGARDDEATPGPPMDGERMAAPGREIDKAG